MTIVLVVRMRLASAMVLAMVALCTRAAVAQTWDWHVAMRDPGHPLIEARTHVVLSPTDVVATVTAHVGTRDVPISSCRAGLADIGGVRPVTTPSGTFLFITMKPPHTAACTAGNERIALVQIGNDANANTAVASISRACCSSVSVASARFATSNPAPRPVPTVIPPLDWVEKNGVFAFLRIRNRDARPLTIEAGQIIDCRDMAYGCGRFADRPITLAPGAIATLATVMSGNPKDATFSFRYQASIGAEHYTNTGLSSKTANDSNVAMSPQQVRDAQAAVLTASGTFRAVPVPVPAPATPSYFAPRLTQRGSTRLGIGQRGVAVLRVSVNANGMPQNASIISISNRALVAAALETAVSSSYAPALRNGRPVDADYIATFQLDGDDPALSSVPVWRRSAIPSSVPSSPPSASPTPSPRASPTPVPTAAPTNPPPVSTAAPTNSPPRAHRRSGKAWAETNTRQTNAGRAFIDSPIEG